MQSIGIRDRNLLRSILATEYDVFLFSFFFIFKLALRLPERVVEVRVLNIMVYRRIE
jgi:hypothetical protein